MKELKALLDKKFSVYVGDEFEGYTDFLGVMQRLAHFSNFFDFSKEEQKDIINKCLEQGYFLVDSQVTIKFKPSLLTGGNKNG